MRILLILSLLWNVIAIAGERISFPGPGVTLSAILYHPAGKGPFPAIVGLHGCGGFDGPAGAPKLRDSDWAERLAKQGYIVVLPDSFGSRAVGAQCGQNPKVRPDIERTADTLAAKKYLQGRSDVIADKISLLGWSNGGSTVLYAINSKIKGGYPDFYRSIAFYPNCRALAKAGSYRPRTPLLILIGNQDPYMSVPACQAIVQQAKAAHQQADMIVYSGVGHAFDSPEMKPEANQKARADVLKRVPNFLRY